MKSNGSDQMFMKPIPHELNSSSVATIVLTSIAVLLFLSIIAMVALQLVGMITIGSVVFIPVTVSLAVATSLMLLTVIIINVVKNRRMNAACDEHMLNKDVLIKLSNVRSEKKLIEESLLRSADKVSLLNRFDQLVVEEDLLLLKLFDIKSEIREKKLQEYLKYIKNAVSKTEEQTTDYREFNRDAYVRELKECEKDLDDLITRQRNGLSEAQNFSDTMRFFSSMRYHRHCHYYRYRSFC